MSIHPEKYMQRIDDLNADADVQSGQFEETLDALEETIQDFVDPTESYVFDLIQQVREDHQHSRKLTNQLVTLVGRYFEAVSLNINSILEDRDELIKETNVYTTMLKALVGDDQGAVEWLADMLPQHQTLIYKLFPLSEMSEE